MKKHFRTDHNDTIILDVIECLNVVFAILSAVWIMPIQNQPGVTRVFHLFF